MQKKPSLGYSLALYLSTVMWIFGMVGVVALIGGQVYSTYKTLNWLNTFIEHDLSSEKRRPARADLLEDQRQWKEFYCPIEELPWLPVPLILCALLGGAGYRIRKGMGEPVSFTELLR